MLNLLHTKDRFDNFFGNCYNCNVGQGIWTYLSIIKSRALNFKKLFQGIEIICQLAEKNKIKSVTCPYLEILTFVRRKESNRNTSKMVFPLLSHMLYLPIYPKSLTTKSLWYNCWYNFNQNSMNHLKRSKMHLCNP